MRLDKGGGLTNQITERIAIQAWLESSPLRKEDNKPLEGGWSKAMAAS